MNSLLASEQITSVLAVVLDDKQSAVLSVLRRDSPVWVLPGGGVEPGESPEQAVCRELLEETGLIASVDQLLAVYLPINSLGEPTALYQLSVRGGGLVPQPDEAAEVAFLLLEHLPRSFFFVHREWLYDGLRHQKGDAPQIRHMREVTYLRLLGFALLHPWICWKYLRSCWQRHSQRFQKNR